MEKAFASLMAIATSAMNCGLCVAWEIAASPIQADPCLSEIGLVYRGRNHAGVRLRCLSSICFKPLHFYV